MLVERLVSSLSFTYPRMASQVLCKRREIRPVLFDQRFIKPALFNIYIGAFEVLGLHQAITHMTKSIAAEIAQSLYHAGKRILPIL